MIQQKNIVYGTILATGNVHVGDKIYTIQQRFQDSHSILFLRIDRNSANAYTATLAAKNAQTGAVDHFEQPIDVLVQTDLFDQITAFQQARRRIDGATRLYNSAGDSPVATEAALIERLYQTFFDGFIGTVCSQFLTLLQQRKLAELLLVVSTDKDNLLQIPWEMLLPRLSSPTGTLPVDSFGLVRTHLTSLDAFNPQGITDRAAPLKLLFITALPENMSESGKQLEIEKEQRLILEAVQGVTSSQEPGLVIEILDCASLADIEKALDKRSHDIVHLSGHGAYLTGEQQGVLVMETSEGDQQIVTGHEFGDVLRRFSSVKLLVLSACETATGGVEGNLARQLADVGLPAVLAMRFSVTDEAARLLAKTLYGALAAGDTLTRAMHRVRYALWNEVQTSRAASSQAQIAAEWFTPVLFQNQGIGSFIDQQQAYDQQTHRRFYPSLTFLRGQHTRLIGENFIGRKRLLIQLKQGFNQHKAMCLWGMGGLGKTTTAKAFAYHYRSLQGANLDVLLFRKGNSTIEELSILHYVVSCWKAHTQPNNAVAADIEYRIKDPNIPVLGKLQAVIDNCLSAWPTVLLFDNTEDVHDEHGRFFSPELRTFLHHLIRHAPRQCYILFTTRYRLTDLDDCLTHLSIDKMTYAEQYRYVQSSEKLRELTPDQQNLVYQRLDGLPRAFEFLETLLVNQPTFDLSQLEQVESDLVENLLLDKLYNSLTTLEQQVFAQVSVLVGRVPIEVISYVLEKPEEELLPVLNSLHYKTLCLKYDIEFEVHSLTRKWIYENRHLNNEEKKILSCRAAQLYKNQLNWGSASLAIFYLEQAESWNDFAELALSEVQTMHSIGFVKEAKNLCIYALPKLKDFYWSAKIINKLGFMELVWGDDESALPYFNECLPI